MPLKVLALNGTSKKTEEGASSTDRMLDVILGELKQLDMQGEVIRLADHEIKPGVTSDEGDGDAWPEIRAKILAADCHFRHADLARPTIERDQAGA